MDLCLYNRHVMPLTEGALPFSDLLIQRGIGCFEAFICPHNKPLAWQAHIDRLRRSAELLKIDIPYSNAELARLTKQGIEAHGNEPLTRIYLTAGDSPQDGRYRKGRLFFLFLDHHDFDKECYSEGIELFSLKTERFWPLAKTCNYSAAFVPMLDKPASSEVLYCPAGEITECHSSNFFGLLDGSWITAPLSRVLHGTTRDLAITLMHETDQPIEERCLKTEELTRLSEAFVTSTGKLIMPVKSIDGRPVGAGKIGPLTARLLDTYRKEIDRFCTDLDNVK